MTGERALAAALDASPAPVRFWWRDDDAGADSEQLTTLARLAASRRAPVALAVVPAWLTAACVERIGGCTSVTVLQHGVAHADHAAPSDKKIELGGLAARQEMLAALADGRDRLADAFGAAFEPVLVPPWNRIAPDLVAALPGLGLTGLSTFGPRSTAEATPGLHRLNTHLDLVVWRDGPRPMTIDEALHALARTVAGGSGEPIGVLSHHAVMDRGAFATLDRLLALVQDQPGAVLASAAALFEEHR